ncbi:hypothetical protein GCM10020229_14860 [Kitasatospora albolonga]|uniref:hypothetical protein n=1 Tax=Kitasatospora albolonga TaxID=68173 RepID=UPI0031E61B9B
MHPLAGFTVGITAAAAPEELATLLQRRGARRAAGRPHCGSCAARRHRTPRRHPGAGAGPPDVAVATTGIGFRGLDRGAEAGASAHELIERLGKASVLARGPKQGRHPAAGLAGELVGEVGVLGGGAGELHGG